ncbi:hypothetical protein GF386_02590 [Candidatus Pacearchaeota archaeon]|nr:hypothetical protein [Candidatus Pacearchaeota archaeon]MBD3283032.1 hypothetical protein [Candidatus Pacearchaeota archaeon]
MASWFVLGSQKPFPAETRVWYLGSGEQVYEDSNPGSSGCLVDRFGGDFDSSESAENYHGEMVGDLMQGEYRQRSCLGRLVDYVASGLHLAS